MGSDFVVQAASGQALMTLPGVARSVKKPGFALQVA